MKAIKSLCLAYSKNLKKQAQPVIVGSKVRLVRNFASFKFPKSLAPEERQEVQNFAKERLHKSRGLNVAFNLKDLSESEQLALQEWGVIHNLSDDNQEGISIFCNDQVRSSVTINDENHLQIQAIGDGLGLKEAWKQCSTIDDFLDDGHYAFQEKLGYLTAHPTDLGTGLHASVCLHLPGFILTGQMEYLARALQQIGISIRNGQREFSQNVSHYFQISNQYTLGIEGKEEVKRLSQVAETIRDQELEIRTAFFEKNHHQVLDKIGRVYGVLSSSYLLGEEESREMLSWMRLAIDLSVFEEQWRSEIDRLTIESQPGNLCILAEQALTLEEQNRFRAERIRQFFQKIPGPNFDL